MYYANPNPKYLWKKNLEVFFIYILFLFEVIFVISQGRFCFSSEKLGASWNWYGAGRIFPLNFV